MLVAPAGLSEPVQIVLLKSHSVLAYGDLNCFVAVSLIQTIFLLKSEAGDFSGWTSQTPP